MFQLEIRSYAQIMNERIWQLWHDNPGLRGLRIPKFVIPPVPGETAKVLVFSFNGSAPIHINDAFRNWMTEIGWINNLGDDYGQRFIWANSPLQENYNDNEAVLSAGIHHGARAFYPWFNRLNQICEHLNQVVNPNQPEIPRIPFNGVEIFNYAHVDLYHLLDANPNNINAQIGQNPAFAQFAQSQKDLSFELLQAWQPKVIICPYKNVFSDIRQFCQNHDVEINLDFLENTFNRVKCSEINLPWGNVLFLVCQNLIRAGIGGYGVNNQEFPTVMNSIAVRIGEFLVQNND